MSRCPDVPKPPGVADLEVDPRNYPIFYAIQNPYDRTQHDFKGLALPTIWECGRERKCGICGQPIGYWVAFVGGPMSCQNRAFTEPPFHPACARYAAQVCPFILRGGWDRSHDTDLIERAKVNDPSGVMGPPPGRTGIYEAHTYQILLPEGHEQPIFRPGPARIIRWILPSSPSDSTPPMQRSSTCPPRRNGKTSRPPSRS